MFAAMAHEEMMYGTAVGPLPVLTDLLTWAPAWALEEVLPNVTETLAHMSVRGIDPARPANPFVKQITAMAHARESSLADRSSSITVVRGRRELSYRRSYLGFM